MEKFVHYVLPLKAFKVFGTNIKHNISLVAPFQPDFFKSPLPNGM